MRCRTPAGALSGRPASKGGAEYAQSVQLAIEYAPATSASTASATSMPAVTPPPLHTRPSCTMRAASGVTSG